MPYKNKQKERRYYRQYAKDHPEQHARAEKKYAAKLKRICFSHYCNGLIRCQCPGCSTRFIGFLQIDHIRGDGGRHKVRGWKATGKMLWLWLIRNNFPSGFQVLCSNCNFAKRNGKRCPLQGKRHR